MKKEKLIEAKETLVKNAVRKIEAGEVSAELYHIVTSELFDIALKEEEKQFRKNIIHILAK